ncbi:hypothetical protein BS333_08720 [Vibrio azureus]|uniref:VopL C-terminal dimerization domain-containing protein n=1 Tax=Vibrio azureus NBRC 104587 TaxID=1219077 RepID=U3AL96_9VIBR|nr:hypothetical protein [Vibrio azureus]AUI86461.1 hypothetical protein BS333_08720 [Vibrio azureus]GAD74072.1 hypothetical protein VAZ01S_001_00100 [Vibrio azureus NBRC 104587]
MACSNISIESRTTPVAAHHTIKGEPQNELEIKDIKNINYDTKKYFSSAFNMFQALAKKKGENPDSDKIKLSDNKPKFQGSVDLIVSSRVAKYPKTDSSALTPPSAPVAPPPPPPVAPPPPVVSTKEVSTPKSSSSPSTIRNDLLNQIQKFDRNNLKNIDPSSSMASKEFTHTSGSSTPPPPSMATPPPPPPPKPSMVQATELSKPQSSSSPSTTRNNLLNQIQNFARENLRNIDPSSPMASNESTYTSDLLFSDTLLEIAPKMDEQQKRQLCNNLSNYIVQAMPVDWTQIVTNELANYSDMNAVENAVKNMPKPIQKYWNEVKRFPDLWKKPDAVSDQAFNGSKGKRVIAEGMRRLNSGKNRTYYSDKTNGATEAKKGEYILESACRFANESATNEEKKTYLANNYKNSAFQVLTEMPFMEVFKAKIGNDAMQQLTQDFMDRMDSIDHLESNLSSFLSENLTNGFASYTYQGQSQKIAALLQQIAKLENRP